MDPKNPNLSRNADLTFPLQTVTGDTIATVGDAADLFSRISEDDRRQNHWQVAIRMLDTALREPSYLRAATMSLQTALAMDGLIEHMRS